mgnify:CR=1 FL=1
MPDSETNKREMTYKQKCQFVLSLAKEFKLGDNPNQLTNEIIMTLS